MHLNAFPWRHSPDDAYVHPRDEEEETAAADRRGSAGGDSDEWDHPLSGGADLALMAMEWCDKHPLRAVRIVLCDHPELVVRALLERDGGRVAMRRALEQNP